jgi:chloramphenicol 3-O phosphotransferase
MKIQVIYLNGPSSAGKSTLAALLQEILPVPYLALGIDTLISLMPKKSNNWTGDGSPAEGFRFVPGLDDGGFRVQQIESGPFGKKIARTYLEVAALLARMGHHLIIDDVALHDGEVDAWRARLKEFPALFVGVKANLADLEKRELARGDRTRGSARAQFAKIRFTEPYDLILNTSERSLEACAQEIAGRCE